MLEQSLNKYSDSLEHVILRNSEISLFPLLESQFEKACQIFKYACPYCLIFGRNVQ